MLAQRLSASLQRRASGHYVVDHDDANGPIGTGEDRRQAVAEDLGPVVGYDDGYRVVHSGLGRHFTRGATGVRAARRRVSLTLLNGVLEDYGVHARRVGGTVLALVIDNQV